MFYPLAGIEFPRSLIELELMHHFSYHMSSTLAFNTDRFRAWQVSLPHLAFECRFVMTAIFAVSALCLCRDKLGRGQKPVVVWTNPYSDADFLPGLDSAQQCLEVANYYYQQTVKDLRFEISPEDNESRRAEFNLAASYVLALYALAYRGISEELNTESTNDGISMDWIIFSRGVHSIKQHCQGSVGFRYSIPGHFCPTPRISDLDLPFSRSLAATMNGAFSELESRLLRERSMQLLTVTLEHSMDDIGACIDACKILMDRAKVVTTRHRPLCLLAWPAQVSNDFVLLLQTGYEPALAVLAHTYTVMLITEDEWWIENMAYLEIRHIKRMFQTQSATNDWLEWIQWPITMSASWKAHKE